VYIDVAPRLLGSFGSRLGTLTTSFILKQWFLNIMMLSGAWVVVVMGGDSNRSPMAVLVAMHMALLLFFMV
jgi:hypothetical protein